MYKTLLSLDSKGLLLCLARYIPFQVPVTKSVYFQTMFVLNCVKSFRTPHYVEDAK